MPSPQRLAAALSSGDEPVMRSYNPTWRDRIASALMGGDRASPERRNFVSGLVGSTGLGNTGVSVADATPVGGILGMQEAAQAGDKVGFGLNAAGTLPLGKMGMFLGAGAKIADKVALGEAQRMFNNNASREAIWNKTGWFMGPDNKWRFEISDHASGFTPQAKQEFINNDRYYHNADRVYDHPDLHSAYPDMWSTNILMERGDNIGGEYHQLQDGRKIIGIEGPDLNTLRESALHELQHDVQGREGFARGGSPSEFPNMPYEQQVENYKKLAGEAEARAVEHRKDMTPEIRRRIYPWKSYDVPFQDQIVKY